MGGTFTKHENMKTALHSSTGSLAAFAGEKDKVWTAIFVAGLVLLWIWLVLFLNKPALLQLESAFLNTMISGILVVVFALLLGWVVGVALDVLEQSGRKSWYLASTFLVNLLRSVPQIVGVLAAYVLLTVLIEREMLAAQSWQLIAMSFAISLFVFLEVADVVRERIAYYRGLDFYHAMLCCGIPERRIINREILWKNSRAHLLHKLISIFGAAIFLKCSVDFIVSVGLSTDVSLTNFPATLGSMLASLDSKQDILAIGTIFSEPGYVSALFFEHLQGISVAFMIVFTLLCVHRIAEGIVRRHKL